jgi:hypothetical protein
MVYFKRENYATEVVLLNQGNGFDFGCAWPLGEDPGLLGCDAVSALKSSRRFERSLCFPRKGEVAREDVLDCLTLGASHAARSI